MTGFYPDLPASAGGGGIGTQITEAVATGAIGDVVSSLSVGGYIAASWIITATDGVGLSAQKIIHATVSGGSATHIESRNGKDVKFTVDVQVNSGDLELLIDNNHGANIMIRALQFATEV
jgi:hypothetical protein